MKTKDCRRLVWRGIFIKCEYLDHSLGVLLFFKLLMCSVSNFIIMTLMDQDGKGILWNCGWAERIPVNWRVL